ncbi:Uncharacterized [Syntrophomonas zehnderi OL-4]|uniref:Uncharacterized n=1 Tax=Syntrophomonas zehnderi OL-4 TaxID=690567 RepID=A0A0E4C7V9_9FIRM|nr:hypothetical protein [Syntrophomonas zehnderi]CFX15507.1 Uncharacterized [Syntrophomonas zehnderi OL-4]
MDLYDFYEKYCLGMCPERRIYSSFHDGKTGICHSCHLDGFIEFVNDSTTQYINLSTLKEEDEQFVLMIMSEISEANNIELDEAFRVIISYGLQCHFEMKRLGPIFNPEGRPPK